MGLLEKVQARVQRAGRTVVGLRLIASKVVGNPEYERVLALADVVPRRCGLCRSFRPDALRHVMLREKAFAQAATLLEPSVMGHTKGVDPIKPVGSERARAIRPQLADRWEDYGGCAKNPEYAVWGFDEAPAFEGRPPCGAWS